MLKWLEKKIRAYIVSIIDEYMYGYSDEIIKNYDCLMEDDCDSCLKKDECKYFSKEGN